jgi:hypothetical protein
VRGEAAFFRPEGAEDERDRRRDQEEAGPEEERGDA